MSPPGAENRSKIPLLCQNPFASYAINGAKPAAVDCPGKLGGNNHVGDDLKESGSSGVSGLTIAECQEKCAGIEACAGYVYLTAACGKVAAVRLSTLGGAPASAGIPAAAH